jgi:hypothetical protein
MAVWGGQVGDRRARHGADRAADRRSAPRMRSDAADDSAAGAADQRAVGFSLGQRTTPNRQSDNANK